jgi:hypothetical protein
MKGGTYSTKLITNKRQRETKIGRRNSKTAIESVHRKLYNITITEQNADKLAIHVTKYQ